MRFILTKLAGVVIIEAEPDLDERGSFTRLYCPEEFARAGIGFTSIQCNLSRNAERHTLRGLHYQDPPFAEAKLVRVTRGAAFDVVVDLRPESATFKHWVSVMLDAESMRAVFVPEGCAHGFLTLERGTDIFYQMGRAYVPGHGKGVRWNDPVFGISWPHPPAVISPRDAEYADFER